MIEHPNFDQRERLSQPAGDRLVRLARLGDTGWMIVTEHNCRGVVMQRRLDHLTDMYLGTVDGAAEHLFDLDQAMPVVEKQYREHLVLAFR